jgi:hypothetical protein
MDQNSSNSASESSLIEDKFSENKIILNVKNDINMNDTTSTSDFTIFTDQLIPEIKQIVQENPKTLLIKSAGGGIKLNRKNVANLFHSHTSHIPISTYVKLKDITTSSSSSIKILSTSAASMKRSIMQKDGSIKNKNNQQHYISRCLRNDLSSYSTNITSDFLTSDDNEKKNIVDEKSNLFLYLDLHGHASKKGVFMYGNHSPNLLESVECMLLPRLMSMNSHHFHFDACNFSEKNMYFK